MLTESCSFFGFWGDLPYTVQSHSHSLTAIITNSRENFNQSVLELDNWSFLHQYHQQQTCTRTHTRTHKKTYSRTPF